MPGAYLNVAYQRRCIRYGCVRGDAKDMESDLEQRCHASLKLSHTKTLPVRHIYSMGCSHFVEVYISYDASILSHVPQESMASPFAL